MNKIISKFLQNNNNKNDAFEILVYYHRLFGIEYVGYKNTKFNIKNAVIVIYGIILGIIILIVNTSCLLFCRDKRSILGGTLAMIIHHISLLLMTCSNLFAMII